MFDEPSDAFFVAAEALLEDELAEGLITQDEYEARMEDLRVRRQDFEFCREVSSSMKELREESPADDFDRD